jgi:peptidoglycan/LPS O-acetylase OafA/YrhL
LIKYRPEIDGLRTVAVVSVLVYHAKLALNGAQLFPGGFFGVDIFFVISGFLITALIRREYQLSAGFSFGRFYQRRARRLLPTLLLVTVASLPVAWAILLPTQLEEFCASILYSLFFLSNFYWHSALLEYGAAPGLLQPFLHTWSLAIEEQYYLTFPLLLVTLLKWRSRYVIASISLLIVISLFYAEITTSQNPSLAFFHLPARLWELLAGGLLALLPETRPHLHIATSKILPKVGLLLIGYAVLTIPLDAGHPGLITLIPIAGTMLIIRYATAGESVTRLLSSKGFVAIGLISYALYLWHYPVFAFGRIIEVEPSAVSKLLWVAISFTLATATYFLLEKPFRVPAIIPATTFVGVTASMLLVISVFSYAALEGNGLSSRFPKYLELYGKNEFDNRALQQQSWDILDNLAAAKGYTGSEAAAPSRFEAQTLWFSNTPGKTRVLIVGNSHSKDLFNALHLNRELFSSYEFARFGLNNDLPEDQLKQLLSAPNLLAADRVLIAFSASTSTVRALPGLLNSLTAANKPVYLSSNSPRFQGREGKPLFDWYIQRQGSTGDLSAREINSVFYNNQRAGFSEGVNSQLQDLAVHYGLRYFSRQALTCDDLAGLCFGMTPEGYKAFFDQHHWTVEGARFYGKRIHALGWLKG